MHNQVGLWGKQHSKLILLVFVSFTLLQAWGHFAAVDEGKPYENWDEVITFNYAKVVSGPTAYYGFRYGPIDTFMQWLALVHYEYFDPIGRAHEQSRYYNNTPESWTNPNLPFFEHVVWPKNVSFGFMRGISDHEPIFLSRAIHLFVFYLAFMVLGVYIIYQYGGTSPFFLLPLAIFSVTPEVYFQATQSLPNALNGVLTFGVLLLAFRYADKGKARDLALAVGLLALGANLKIDIVIIAVGPVLAIFYCLSLKGWKRCVKDATFACLIGLLLFLVTRPHMFVAPLMEMRVQYHAVRGHSVLDGVAALETNLSSLADFLASGLVWKNANPAASVIIIGLMLALVGFAILLPLRRKTLLCIGLVVTLACWFAACYRPPAADRYFINGFATLLATLSMMLYFLVKEGGAGRKLAILMFPVLFSVWFTHAQYSFIDSLESKAQRSEFLGLDPAHNRNIASLEAIKLLKSGRYGNKLFIDQHSYIDLRIFWENGIEPQFVNMDNFPHRLFESESGQEGLFIYSLGSSELAKYVPDPGENLRSRYEQYVNQLSKLDPIVKIEGQKPLVFSIAPLEPKVELFIAVL